MPHARNNVLLFHALHSLGDHRLVAVLDEAHQLPRSQGLEVLLHLAEHVFDRIVLRAVGQIIDPLEAQVLHRLFGLLRFMAAQVVHEKADLVRAVDRPESSDILNELLHVHGEVKDLIILLSFLFRDAAQQCQSRFVQLLEIDGHILLGATPLSFLESLSGEHGLVNVDDPISTIFCLSEQPLHRGQRLLRFLLVGLLRGLVPPELLLLDLVEGVDVPEQSRIHLGLRKLSPEVPAPVHDREKRLSPESVRGGEPLNLVLLQKSIPEPLARFSALRLLQPLEERQGLHLVGLESGHVQLPHLRSGDAEEFSKKFVAQVGGARM